MVLVFFVVFVFCVLIAFGESYYERDWPRDTGKFAIITGILFLSSLLIFGENTRWNMPSETLITLLGIAGFAIVALRLRELSAFASFEPYSVVIGINFEILCKDLALQWNESEPRKSDVFTAITPALFQYSDGPKFMHGISVVAEVPCAQVPWNSGPGSRLVERPRFFFRRYGDEYQFGVIVAPEWWERHKGEASPDLRQLYMRSDGEIVIALLPAGYIPDHVRHEYGTVSRFYSFQRKQRQWKARLSKLGWSIEEYDPGNIQHRYLGIGFYVI